MRVSISSVYLFLLVFSSFITLSFHWKYINLLPQLIVFFALAAFITVRSKTANARLVLVFVCLSFFVLVLSEGGGWQAALKLLNFAALLTIFNEMSFKKLQKYFVFFALINLIFMLFSAVTGVSLAVDSDIYFYNEAWGIYANSGFLKEMNYSGIISGVLVFFLGIYMRAPAIFASIMIATSRISYLIPLLYFFYRLLNLRSIRVLMLLSPLIVGAYTFYEHPVLLLERFYLWDHALKLLNWSSAVPLSELTTHMSLGHPMSPWSPKTAVHSGFIENLLLNGPLIFIFITVLVYYSALRMSKANFIVFFYLYASSFIMSLSLGGLSATSMLYSWTVISGLVKKNEIAKL